MGLGPRKKGTHTAFTRNLPISFKNKEKPIKNEENTSIHVEKCIGKPLKYPNEKAHPQEEW